MTLRGWRLWLAVGGGGFLLLLLIAAYVWRDDILRSTLDPEVPFQTYAPPRAPDYAKREAWALLPSPAEVASDGRVVDVFFVHPTTYDGGRHWNGPFDDPKAARQLASTMLPNYAGPFYEVGRVYAPRYRQASLYSYLTRRDDALEARRFAYGDVERAFRVFLDQHSQGRPFLIVGVEQGAFLADRLLHDVVAPDPALTQRLVAGYLMRAVTPAARFPAQGPIPPCAQRRQTHCVMAFVTAPGTGAERARELLGWALVWGQGAQQLENLEGPALCVNPLLGRTGSDKAPSKANLGAANATDLEWGVRPAFLPRQVAAQCIDGVLRVSRPKSSSLRAGGVWANRLKAPGFNVFFADLEADAMGRVAAQFGRADFPHAAKPITGSVAVVGSAVNRVD